VVAGGARDGFTEWAYVAGSRHRESIQIHADRATLAELAPAWSKAKAEGRDFGL